MAEHLEVPAEIVRRLRPMCLALPEAHEADAWVGTRWIIRKRAFAHVVRIESGWPPAYARALGSDGPAVVLTFRAAGPELDALRHQGPPFFKPVWFGDIVGIRLAERTDWVEIAELLLSSYCVQAPKRLALIALQTARVDGGET